jgi:spore coat protein U-like protein
MRTLLLAAIAGTAVLASPAKGGTASGTIEVSLQVLPACRVETAPLAFSTTQGTVAQAQTPVEVACTSDSDVSVALDAGRHAVGSQPRLAADDGTFVAYTVYSDPARTRRWTGQTVLADVTAAQPLQLIAYGQVTAANAIVPAGEYRDTLTVTVTF